jgi:hypothetical protein
LLFISLQEIATIAASFLGGQLLTEYVNAIRTCIELTATKLDTELFKEVSFQHVGMTAYLLFAKPKVSNRISHVSTAGVGVGWWQMGNKGAVACRVDYRPSSDVKTKPVQLSFVAAHLAPAESAVKRRNNDWENITKKLVFTSSAERSQQTIESDEPSNIPAEDDTDEDQALLQKFLEDPLASMGLYTPTTHIFLAGDLNYRTSNRSPTADDQLLYPRPTSDTSSKVHFSHLLLSDQLNAERSAGRTCHGLAEAKIDFAPTYKFAYTGRRLDGTGFAKEAAKIKHSESSHSETLDEWNWAPWRWPSWCDRVLYTPLPSWYDSTRSVKVNTYTSLPLLPSSDHRPVLLSLSIPAEAIPVPSSEVYELAKTMERPDPRVVPPFPIETAWHLNRSKARNLEYVVGVLAYLGTTRTGKALIFSTVFIGWISVWLWGRSQI